MTLPQETAERIIKDAESYGENKGEYIYNVTQYSTHNDIAHGYEIGATAEANLALEREKVLVEALREILKYSSYYTIKEIATKALANYEGKKEVAK